MKAIETYHDLCTEISILEIRLDGLIDERNYLDRQIHRPPRVKLVASYSGMPGAGMDMTPLDRQWKALCNVKTAIEDVSDILSLKRECKRRMEARMQEFEGLEFKVAYMRDIQQLPLYEIAEKLQYSENWIYKISSRIGKMKARNDLQTVV